MYLMKVIECLINVKDFNLEIIKLKASVQVEMTNVNNIILP